MSAKNSTDLGCIIVVCIIALVIVFATLWSQRETIMEWESHVEFMPVALLFCMRIIFGISLLAVVVFMIAVCGLTVLKTFEKGFDSGFRSILGILLALVVSFVFYHFNRDIVVTFGEAKWWLLFVIGVAFGVGIMFFVSRFDIVNSDVTAAVFCFALTFGLSFSLLAIMTANKSNVAFLPIGFFIGSSVYIIFDSKFSFYSILQKKRIQKYSTDNGGFNGNDIIT